LKTKLNDVAFHALSNREHVGYTDDELNEIFTEKIPLYRVFLDELGEKMEVTLVDHLVAENGNCDKLHTIELLTDEEIAILEELRHIAMVYTISYKYNVKKLAASFR
jgi:hypothetical protein